MNFIPVSGDKSAITINYYKPTLYITPTALAKMRIYVEECDKEVGWLGEVEQLDKDYICKDVFLPGQDTHSSTTEIQPDDLVKLAEENEDELLERLLLWGHSHVNMSTSPSGQDNDQINLFKNNKMPFFFRVIANKKGDLTVTYYDIPRQITVTDSAWCVYNEVNLDEELIKQEIKDKVREKTYTNSYTPIAGQTYGKIWEWNDEKNRYDWKDDEPEVVKKNSTNTTTTTTTDTDTADEEEFFMAECLEEELTQFMTYKEIEEMVNTGVYESSPNVQAILLNYKIEFEDMKDLLKSLGYGIDIIDALDEEIGMIPREIINEIKRGTDCSNYKKIKAITEKLSIPYDYLKEVIKEDY